MQVVAGLEERGFCFIKTSRGDVHANEADCYGAGLTISENLGLRHRNEANQFVG